MRFSEIAGRLNGFSIGPFSVGAQWTPKPSDVEIARRVIRFLEDRRILYNDYAHEEPTHCIESVISIRRFLTEEIVNLKDGSDLLATLRIMRAACRKFLDRLQLDNGRLVRLHYGHESFDFYSALGELRGAMGPQVGILAVKYEIDVEDELAKTLPIEDKND